MSDSDTDEGPGSPLHWLRRVLRRAWTELKSVYYANAPIWRLLKSGALLFLGLFAWTGSNLLLSYRPEWGFLWYVMAYGFALLFWGPFTHLVVVPLVIRLRRSGATGVGRVLSRHGSKLNLGVFLTIVLLLGTYPVGPMTFEFQLPESGETGGVNPQLQCTRSDAVVHCHLSDGRGVGSMVVTSGGETVTTVEDPPFDFDLQIAELASTRGQKQFTVELRDDDGTLLRRYVRQVQLIPGSGDQASLSVPPRGQVPSASAGHLALAPGTAPRIIRGPT